TSTPGTPNSTTPGTSGTTPGTSASTASAASSSTGEKLVPIPWNLLRPSGMTGRGASSDTTSAISTTSEQMTFVFSGDQAKLTSAPSFDKSSWPDISQPNWRQSVFSHF